MKTAKINYTEASNTISMKETNKKQRNNLLSYSQRRYYLTPKPKFLNSKHDCGKDNSQSM